MTRLSDEYIAHRIERITWREANGALAPAEQYERDALVEAQQQRLENARLTTVLLVEQGRVESLNNDIIALQRQLQDARAEIDRRKQRPAEAAPVVTIGKSPAVEGADWLRWERLGGGDSIALLRAWWWDDAGEVLRTDVEVQTTSTAYVLEYVDGYPPNVYSETEMERVIGADLRRPSPRLTRSIHRPGDALDAAIDAYEERVRQGQMERAS